MSRCFWWLMSNAGNWFRWSSSPKSTTGSLENGGWDEFCHIRPSSYSSKLICSLLGHYQSRICILRRINSREERSKHHFRVKKIFISANHGIAIIAGLKPHAQCVKALRAGATSPFQWTSTNWGRTLVRWILKRVKCKLRNVQRNLRTIKICVSEW